MAEVMIGKDSSGKRHPVLTDSNGAIIVNLGPDANPINVGTVITEATYNSTLPTLSSGSAGSLQSDANGRLISRMIDDYQAAATTTWTTSTTANTALTSPTSGYDTVIVTATIGGSGTINAGSFVFEVYDGATWLPIKSPRIESYATDTTVVLKGVTSAVNTGLNALAWQIPVAGFSQYRTRLTAAITQASGTNTVTITHLVSSAPDTSLVTVGLDPSQSVIPLAGIASQTGTATTTSAQVTFTSAPTKFFLIQNTAASGTLYVNFGAAATTSSLALAPGVAYETPVVPTNSVNVLGSASVTYVILSA
jgi:hypothetical protein